MHERDDVGHRGSAGEGELTPARLRAVRTREPNFLKKRMKTEMLAHKVAVIFGASGSIGAAIAKEFAREGARLYLAGRTRRALDGLAQEIKAGGGEAQSESLDVLDDAAVGNFGDAVVRDAGGVDIHIDVSGTLATEFGNVKLAVELPIEQFMVPLMTMVRSRFSTARAVARHMAKNKSGVIIFVTGSSARPHVPGATAIGAAFGAMKIFQETSRSNSAPQGSGWYAFAQPRSSIAGPSTIPGNLVGSRCRSQMSSGSPS